MVSERYDSMAPPTLTVAQRVEELEESVAGLEVKLSSMVSKAVEAAVGSMKHTLVDLML